MTQAVRVPPLTNSKKNLQRRRWVAGALVLALTLLALAMPPAYNWDMLPYVALSLPSGDDQARHKELWRLVELDVPESKQALLRGQIAEGNSDARQADTLAYRRETASNAQAFTEQLPFYAVKPMYPMAIAGLTGLVDGALGVNTLSPISASITISKFAWVAFGVSFFTLLCMRLGQATAAVAALAIMTLPAVHTLSSYSTPDALSATLIMLAFVLALRDPSRTWTVGALGVALLGVAARPDNLMLLGLLLVWFHYNGRVRLVTAVLVGLIGFAWYVLIAKISGNYGWSVLMHHSFIDYAEYPSKLAPTLSSDTLVALYLSKLGSSMLFFQCVGVCVLCVLLRWYRRGARDQLLQALLVMLGFMLAHWLVFPDQKDRLLVAPYLFVLASLLFVIADLWADTVSPALQARGLFKRRGEVS